MIVHSSYHGMGDTSQNDSEPDINLDCGRPVSFSYYDDLIGIRLRYSHPMHPDPEVSFLDDTLFFIFKFEIEDIVHPQPIFLRLSLHLQIIRMQKTLICA